METREWLLAAAVILVPLAIAVVVTLWLLKQVQYRRKAWKPPSASPESVSGSSDRRTQSPDDTAAS